MKIDWMKLWEAESELLSAKENIENFLSWIEWEVKLAQDIDVWVAKPKILEKWKYRVSAKEYSGINWVAPRVYIEWEWQDFDMKATRFLRLTGRWDERDELKQLCDIYLQLRDGIKVDLEDMWKKEIGEIKDKTKWRFRTLIWLKWKNKH